MSTPPPESATRPDAVAPVGPQSQPEDWVDDVDDTRSVWAQLEEDRRTVAANVNLAPAPRIRRMIALGMWDEAAEELQRNRPLSGNLLLAEAELRFKQNRFREAGARVAAILARAPDHRDAHLLGAALQLQAWNLAGAEATVTELLNRNPEDEESALLLGQIAMHRKQYDEALEWARRVQRWNPNNADAFALEAEIRFWNQDAAGAEEPLRKALAIDPYNADARFSYGYAIWRRVDATQLDAMAAQWELALAVDPLHYRTHWHWGNGHTNLTYADYAHPTDSVVRVRLARGDNLIARNQIEGAIALTREVERESPQSVLPAMMRGSAFYMAYDMPTGPRLDSAEATFAAILARKPHYGPAHNGLAAVIKQRQFAQLSRYDSLEAHIATVPAVPDSTFDAIFPDAAYYPGDRVERMIRAQLGPSRAYLPMLARFDVEFAIPPLHRDLADAMGRPSFRTTTTFDNRQWMDIRGVGSGATGIEYVERGSHWERNVLAHEYTHLVHGRVFTDEERRRVRALYYEAMELGRTLDYYASNNESEFLAQAYPAALAPVKAHPLNHKSHNTRSDLQSKDPETSAFVDSLIQRQQAYLDGDSTALRSNWSHVFMRLSEAARPDSREAGDESDASDAEAQALLDTALMWDPSYLPAHLSYAGLMRDRQVFDDAERWLQRANDLDSTYAPIHVAHAELLAAKVQAEAISEADGFDGQVLSYRRALTLEDDLAARASLNTTLRRLYRDHARMPEAIAVAEEYARSGPTISTYLRDRRVGAEVFAQTLRSDLGYSTQTLDFFTHLVGQRPQDFRLRGAFADALAGAGRYADAIATLEEAQRILRAAGRPNQDFLIQIAEFSLALGDGAAARSAIDDLGQARERLVRTSNRLVRVLVSLGDTTAAGQWMEREPSTPLPAERADEHFTRGYVIEHRGNAREAEQWYRRALEANPYHRGARTRLIVTLATQRNRGEIRRVLAAAASLEIPLGPDFERDAGQARRSR